MLSFFSQRKTWVVGERRCCATCCTRCMPKHYFSFCKIHYVGTYQVAARIDFILDDGDRRLPMFRSSHKSFQFEQENKKKQQLSSIHFLCLPNWGALFYLFFEISKIFVSKTFSQFFNKGCLTLTNPFTDLSNRQFRFT